MKGGFLGLARRARIHDRAAGIHPGAFGSVKDLTAKIRAYIDGWNDRCHPSIGIWDRNLSSRQLLRRRPT